ncbi:hypothetical protein Ddye_032316 [Dipteronia dyeriana]|uniref:glucan endo-1,3-beta-D-glucosidase n=1 Tax=Dipteronia dyeriana TaxID=168575 RepID=A0AAD9TJZ3_9ROSI|nr:hypothetical protein Ddye_032316 [Dipteronia dyeriana]
MSTTRSKTTIILLLSTIFLHLTASTTAIGVNYGTLSDNLPPPTKVAEFLQTKTTIDRIKLFDANPEILRAFANTSISVTVTVGNGDIPGMVEASTAQKWVADNIAPYYLETKIIRVTVGNEILKSAVKNWIVNLVPAMKSLHKALVNAGFKDIQVSTPHTLSLVEHSEPPSAARFRVGYDKQVIIPMLQFLRETKSPLMINPYPYFGWAQSVSDYCLFKPNKGIYDENTKITYMSMFDAIMDAVYTSMKAIDYDDIEIVIAETGWSSAGDPEEAACSVENAKAFNGNVARRATESIGTPLMPKKIFETYIFALFNENLKSGGTSEKNFGLFKPDFTPVYDIGIMKTGQQQDSEKENTTQTNENMDDFGDGNMAETNENKDVTENNTQTHKKNTDMSGNTTRTEENKENTSVSVTRTHEHSGVSVNQTKEDTGVDAKSIATRLISYCQYIVYILSTVISIYVTMH